MDEADIFVLWSSAARIRAVANRWRQRETAIRMPPGHSSLSQTFELAVERSPRGSLNRCFIKLAIVAVFVAGATQALAQPDCLHGAELSRARVVGVGPFATLILADRRVVKVEALLMPAGEKDNAPEVFRGDALAAMQELAVGKEAILHTRDPKVDRYRRLRAQIIFEDRFGKRMWLQQEMLRRGLARVSILPDRRECAGELYAAEDLARLAKTGLWSSDVYAVRTPDSIRWRDLGTFQIVEGKVANAAVRGSRAYLNFGRDWRKDFTVTISPEDMKAFRSLGVDPQSFAGKTLRVHGWIDRLNGFEIEAEAPEQIEIVKSQQQ